jgi:putative intracellular protease/amidase
MPRGGGGKHSICVAGPSTLATRTSRSVRTRPLRRVPLAYHPWVPAVTRIGIAVFDGVEELDFVGPWEVLSAWRSLYPDDLEVVLVGETDGPVRCAKGMRVLPDTTWEAVGSIDALVYPGGRGTRAQLGDERIGSRLRTLKASGTLMTSVCTGALVFGDAGLLDGLPAATHWGAFDELLSLGQAIEPRPEERFVDAGNGGRRHAERRPLRVFLGSVSGRDPAAGSPDPDQLRRRFSPHLGPCVGQVVLHGRLRQPGPVGGGLLRPCGEDGRDHPDLTVGRALGGVSGPARHALRSQSYCSGGSSSRFVIGRSMVARLRLLHLRPQRPA